MQKRKRKDSLYGNYHGYYKSRAVETGSQWSDARIYLLKSVQEVNFENSTWLDIGCNDGHLTHLLTLAFNPSRMTGVDIDHKLVSHARGFTKLLNKWKKLRVDAFYWTGKKKQRGNLIEIDVPVNIRDIVDFQHRNVMKDVIQPETCKYDVISMFSVSKWIHLHHGDEGIKTLFSLVYDRLKEGGIFIFEPQKFDSYKKHKTLDENTLQNFQSIELTPSMFLEFLEGVGFSLVSYLPPVEKSGYSRPIYVLKKQ